MRFGILLPRDGPLAENAALEATGQAAEELDYASVWSSSLSQLSVVVGCTLHIPTVLHINRILHPHSVVRVGARAVSGLTGRLQYVAAEESALAYLRPELGGRRLLSTSSALPADHVADGWAPILRDALSALAQWDSLSTLVVRTPHRPSAAELNAVLVAGADELVVSLPAARTLDEQLAGFAEIAEDVLRATAGLMGSRL